MNKNRYIKNITIVYCSLLLSGVVIAQPSDKTDYSKYVDPFIGTQGGGNTFPGPSYPFGLVRLGPDCDNLNSNMGYLQGGKVRGFSHLHLSGTGGGPKYGNILVYPFSGDVQISGYGSGRGHEIAKVGYFSVELKESNILAELASTHKTGIHKYTFNNSGKAGILIDAGSFLGKEACCSENQELVGSEINILSKTEISGYSRVRGGWNNGGPYTVFFYTIFDTPAQTIGTWKSGIKHYGNNREYDSGEPVGAWFEYNFKSAKTVLIKVGISFISIGKAKENCLTEAASISFEQAVDKSKVEWNKYLKKVVVESKNDIEKVKFYTALYHIFLQPSDRTGENPLWPGKAPYYDDFYCIWDTYRTSNPFIGIIAEDKQSEIVNALINIYEHEGYMPEGRSGNSNGRTQGGSNADMLMAEAILKDFKGVNYEKAYEAMLKDAEVSPGGDERKEGRGGLADYNTIGYVSTTFERAGTRTVEYAANDWAIAQCALKLGKKEDYEKYCKRAANWKNLWKPIESEGAKGFIMPRKSNGDWDENFSEITGGEYYAKIQPYQVGIIAYNKLPQKYLSTEKFTTLKTGTWMNFFYESHSWEYSLYVPHDVKQLIYKCGGNDAFISRLDTYFSKKYHLISNEPGFLTPCLYIYAGRQDKTAKLVNQLLKENYTDKPNGIPGNDDSGAMSSWFAFNKIGFFPNAGQDVYLISTPSFKKVTLNINDSTIFEVITENLSDKNLFIQSAELNGKPLYQAWFKHAVLKNGGTLRLVMSNKPSSWGSKNLPPSQSDF